MSTDPGPNDPSAAENQPSAADDNPGVANPSPPQPPYPGPPPQNPYPGPPPPPPGPYPGPPAVGGYAQSAPGYPAPYGYVDPMAKSRMVAGILGILLGGLGIHRFYLGYTSIGVLQIIVTIVTCGIGAIWGLIEGIMILVNSPSFQTDAKGVPLRE